jgi:hypothetical protein
MVSVSRKCAFRSIEDRRFIHVNPTVKPLIGSFEKVCVK